MESPGSSLSVVRVETTAPDTFEREAVRGKRPVIFKPRVLAEVAAKGGAAPEPR
jgi:hypothetical protein